MLPPSEDETLGARKSILSTAKKGKEKSLYHSPEPKPTYDSQGNKGLISPIETIKQTSYGTLTSLTQERGHASSTIGRGLSQDDLNMEVRNSVFLSRGNKSKFKHANNETSNHNKSRKYSKETSTDSSTAKKQKVTKLNPDIAFKNKLKEIEEAYTKAVNCFRQKDYDKAEKEIINILKPVLGNPGPDILPSSYIKQVANVVLDSLYHLGVIYLNSSKYKEKYTKAAAIFQYCQNFYIEYKPEFQVNSKEIEPAYFESLALSTERLFLLSLSISSISNSLSEQGMLPALYFCRNYKNPLNEFRSGISLELEKIKEYSIKDIYTRVNAVKSLYSKCSNFFINKQSTGFVQRIMQDCFNQLDYKLEPDGYAIISLGSLALGTMTPWSDLEFAILVRFSDHKEYFREFTKLLQIKIINLGETILPIVGVEALNNVRTGNEEDEWFWDGLTQRGFCLDGKRWYACKSAIGRQGGYKILKKLNGESILIDLPDYELILTTDEMAEFQSDSLTGTSWFKTDKYLVQALRFATLIMGSQNLFDDYKEKLRHKISIQILQSRALELLQEDVSKYCLKLDPMQEGQLLNAKELYRLIDRVISALGNYFEIDTMQENTGFTSWQILEQIMLKGKISEEGKVHLDEALTITAELRLHVYLHNSGQKEWISACPFIKSCFKKMGEPLEKSNIFHFMDTPILHHFYYIMLRLQYIIQNYSGPESIDILKTDPIFDDCDFNKGKVHMRFLEYTQAKLYLERAHTYEPENLQILSVLFFLYTKMLDHPRSKEVVKKISKLKKALLSQDIETTEILSQDYVMHTDDPPPEDDKPFFSHLIYEQDDPIKVLGIDFDLYTCP